MAPSIGPFDLKPPVTASFVVLRVGPGEREAGGTRVSDEGEPTRKDGKRERTNSIRELNEEGFPLDGRVLLV